MNKREKKLKYLKDYYQKNKAEKQKYAREKHRQNKEKINERRKQLRKLKPDQYKKARKKWLKKNPDRRKAETRKYREKYKDIIKKRQSDFRKKNRKYFNAYTKKYRSTPQGKIAHSMRNRIRLALKNQGAKKFKTTFKLVGCSLKKLKDHIEKQFKPGMTWKNYGLETWHIDHIIPVSKFNLLNPKEQRICFNYKNLQPLWAKENFLKSNK